MYKVIDKIKTRMIGLSFFFVVSFFFSGFFFVLFFWHNSLHVYLNMSRNLHCSGGKNVF